MNIFKLRPLALGCFCFLICLYISYFLGNIFDILLIAIGTISLATLITLAALKRRDSTVKILIKLLPTCLCLALCGIISLTTFVRDEKIYDEYVDTEVELEMLVEDVRYSKEYESLVIAKSETERGDVRISLTLPKNEIKTGDKIKATVTLSSFAATSIGYSERDYYLDKGIFLYGETEEYELLSSGTFVPSAALEKANDYLVSLVEKSVNGDTAAFVSAMLLGNKDTLGEDVRRDFSRLGISHILALSGIHLSLITSMANAFFELIQMRRRLKYSILILMITAFIGITGFSDSAMRAGLMLIIFYTVTSFGMKKDGVTALFSSALIICTLDPYAIFSNSLLLSFCAMLACICTSYFIRRAKHLRRIKPKMLRRVLYALISSSAVVIFTLPIMAIRFDYVSIFAPVFNLIFVPILTIVLYLSPFVLLLGRIPYLSLVFTYPAEQLVRFVLFLTKNVARADFLTVSFTTTAHTIGIVVMIIAIVLALILNKKMKRLCVCILALGIGIFTAGSIYTAILRTNTVTISAYDHRASDVLAIESKNEVMIIEASSPSKTTMVTSNAYASHIGYSDIEMYVITDYSYRIVEAFENITDVAMIRNVRVTPPMTEEEREQYNALKEIATRKGITIALLEEKLCFYDTEVVFMSYEKLPRSTRRCVAFSVSTDNERFTYLGSAAYECINYFPGNYARASDVVLLGSYGPNYHLMYDYDLTCVDYLVFHGKSREFLGVPVDTQKIKPHMHKFIFK